MRTGYIASILMVLPLVFSAGCATVTRITTTVAVVTGHMSQAQADAAVKVAEAGEKAMTDLTPENEYYIGRAVTASALAKDKPFNNDTAIRYLNLIGQTLAMVSDKPETFGGYHFLIMDTQDVNAFAAPGGLIVVSRGLLKCCKTEDALAAVLAHEIGHVQNDDALKAVKGSRWTSFFTVAALGAAQAWGPKELAQATTALEGTLDDISQKLFISGFGSSQEYAADQAAVNIMKRVGYNPQALKQMLEEMEKHTSATDKGGFGKTHPPEKNRIARIEDVIKDSPPPAPVATRQARFNKALSGI